MEIKGDKDWFAINLIAGNYYQFDMNGDSLEDAYLYLRDSLGNLITYDDQSGGNNDASSLYNALTTGIYYLEASSYLEAFAGTYTITTSLITVQTTLPQTSQLLDHYQKVRL